MIKLPTIYKLCEGEVGNRLIQIEKALSHARITGNSILIASLKSPTELIPIMEGKKSCLKIIALFCASAFINLDNELLLQELQNNTIDGLVNNSKYILPYLRESIYKLKLPPSSITLFSKDSLLRAKKFHLTL